jgi:hypothetical protein
MADEPTDPGWLPPRAPGGEPAPQFEPAPPDPEPEPDPWPQPAQHPVFSSKQIQRPNRLATTSLVLGALGLVILIPTLGAGFIFSLPCSIAAWVTGVQGRNQVASGAASTGDGTAHAGVILGVVGVVLGLIGAALWIALYLSGYDVEDLRRDLERRTDPDAEKAVIAGALSLLGR